MPTSITGATATGSDLPTILQEIVADRRARLPEIRQRIAHVDPTRLPASTRSLYTALGGWEPEGRSRNRFIMECKSASPSLGSIRPDYHPGDLARIYSRYAAAISVLCEPDHFRGDYTHLATVAASTHLPVLCKDFIIDPVQIHAARYFGADAVLLMLSVLNDAEYRELADAAEALGLDVLTEVVTEEEVRRAVHLRARIIGINHRNLHDLSIDLDRSRRLAALLPDDAVVVAESGIRDHRTVVEIGARAHGFLVGSQLTGQPDVDLACRELVFGRAKVCGLRTGAEAQAARAAGASYGGLIFAEDSPRNVSRETALSIMAGEPGLRYVAVSRRSQGWEELAAIPGIHALQVQTPTCATAAEERQLLESVARQAGEVPLWRAVSIATQRDADLAAEVASWTDLVSTVVLDTGRGGTGTSFDWSLIPANHRERYLLAGGIGPDTIVAAAQTGCGGVDLNSRVEYPPSADTWAGHKDPAAITHCLTALRHASAPIVERNS